MAPVNESDISDLTWELQVDEILEAARYHLSTIKPSEWNERHRIMTSDVSPFPGKFSYERTPYLREVVDCCAPDHPAQIVAVMKGAQIGFSTGVIEAAIGWIISQNPGNILFLTGHADLADEAMTKKIDQMIDSTGLRTLIRPNVLRTKNMRTGDTNKSKEFPGGSLISGAAGNHKLLRQRSVRYGFIDDFDAAKQSTKESGSTTEMIEQRFAAYANKMKLYYISTPELKQTSNIEPVFLKGDQRRYHVPCPCCHELIPLMWSVKLDDKESAGISYRLDDNGKLIPGTVGYVCQKCSGFFTDQRKHELLMDGKWIPMAMAQKAGYYSYHLSSLYAPPGMFDWEHYVRMYLEANPQGEPMKIAKMKTFTNVVLGETWEDIAEAPKATQLQKNTRRYDAGIIPEGLSIADGNGHIVLLTCACDLNGKVDDARLDYEVVAWSESGASYSVCHGSVGTFIHSKDDRSRQDIDRARWTYEHHRERSVWPTFKAEVLEKMYQTDTGRSMRIFISGVDTGHFTNDAYTFIDYSNLYVVGLKGKDDKYQRFGIDVPKFHRARERAQLYLVEVNQLKDDLAELMQLKWDARHDSRQPYGFMNFPTPSNGLYQYRDYFSHFESEHRVIKHGTDGEPVGLRWEKKSEAHFNHMFDCRIYNMAVRDILLDELFRSMKLKQPTWNDYVTLVMQSLKK